jgi:hypothetical protein
VEAVDLSKAMLKTGPTTAMAMASYKRACKTRRVVGDIVEGRMK